MRIILAFVLVLFLSGCASKEDSFVSTVFQTKGATLMKEYRQALDKFLLQLGRKLILRNKEIFSQDILFYIRNDINNNANTINLPLVSSTDETNFKEYIKIAFSQKKIKKRGDYLLVGLYKMFYWSFEAKSFHKLSALQYDGNKLQEAYEILQAVAWKIKVAKDNRGNYLYLTWQNNWQVELQKRLKRGEKLTTKLIKSLKYIKNKKESLLSPSNLSFEALFAKMLFVYERALKTVGVEPKSLGVDALRTIFLML